jgi:hypothetical protein
MPFCVRRAKIKGVGAGNGVPPLKCFAYVALLNSEKAMEFACPAGLIEKIKAALMTPTS